MKHRSSTPSASSSCGWITPSWVRYCMAIEHRTADRRQPRSPMSGLPTAGACWPFALTRCKRDSRQGPWLIRAIVLKQKGTAIGRAVSLPPTIASELRARRLRQLEERLWAGSRWQEHGPVFTTTIGTPLDGSNVTHRLQAILERAGLPRMRFHDLRHAAGSLLLAQGVSAPRGDGDPRAQPDLVDSQHLLASHPHVAERGPHADKHTEAAGILTDPTV